MSRVQRTVGITVLLVLAVLRPICAAAQDAVPPLIQISGDLSDQKGKPLSGAQTVTFALYMEQSGDAPLWVEVQVVTADGKGHFVALLGATSPGGLPLNLFTTGQARWLGMQASGQAELPRTFLASVPYALAPLSAVTGSSQPVAANGVTNTPLTTASVSSAASTTSAAVAAAAPIVPVSPPIPIVTVVTDSTSGLTSSKSGSTVTLSLITGCATGQLLKWNGSAWGCTADTNVTIDVTGGGLNVLANGTSPNIVGGYGGNTVATGAFGGAIGGGGEGSPDGALCPPFPAICNASNRVAQSFGTVAGGENNQAGDTAGAPASRSYATVGGGRLNVASGLFSTVPGGNQNAATGTSSFAAGFNAQANHNGSFVWSDNSSATAFASTAANQFLLRASGGVGIGTNAPTTTLDVRGHLNLQDAGNNGVFVFPSSGSGLFVRSGVDSNYTERLFISGSSGRVGIGTTTPSELLDVAGNVNVGGTMNVAGATTASNISAAGNISAASVMASGFVKGTQLCIGSDCRSGWPTGGGAGGIGGGGVVNFLPKFVTADFVGTSLLFDNGSAVGLGTATPNGKFHVKGGDPDFYGGHFETSHVEGTAVFAEATYTGDVTETTGVAGVSDSVIGFGVTGRGATGVSGSGKIWGVYGSTSGAGAGVAGEGSASGPGGYFFNADANGKALVASGATEVLTVRTTGKVGIQNPDPGEALDVNGNVKANGLCIGTDCRSVWPAGGGTITGVTPGPGLAGGGASGNVTLGVDFAATQQRVAGTCPAGNAIQTVNGNGSVGCVPVVAGLSGSGTQGSIVKFGPGGVTVGNSRITDDGTNIALGDDASGRLSVLGGASGIPSIIAGFKNNTGTTPDGQVAKGATIAGGGQLGSQNMVTGDFGTIGGGTGNTAGVLGAVPGGELNTASGLGSFAAGDRSQATGKMSTVGGGSSNAASGDYATVPGGALNTAAGYNSFAAGFQATASHQSTFVWNDGVGTFESTAPDQFLIHATGGVGIGTPAPAEALDVVGNVKADGLCIGTDCRTAWPSGGGSALTGVTAGQGLTGGGTTGNVTVSIAGGGVTNAMLQNSSLTLTAGPGLSGGGVMSLGDTRTLSVDFGATQARLSSTCNSGSAIRAVDASGGVTCEPVVAGLAGSGTPTVIPKFTGGTSLGNSRIIDDATNVVLGDSTLGSIKLLGNATSPNLISGAVSNSITAGIFGATISGGGSAGPVGGNHVNANFGTVGGGDNNTSSSYGTVAGGSGNAASNNYASVAGGQQNNAAGLFAAVAGGFSNTAGGTDSVVGGGTSNGASGDYATVPGGFSNIAAGSYSFAAGKAAEANHSNTFVWSDGLMPFASTGINQFLIQASGGVGIGTSNPTQALDVSGNVKANGLCIGTDCRTAWPTGGGTGAVTSVIAGPGLTGSGTTGDVTLGVATGGVTNAMLQNSGVTIGAGLGLSGGGTVGLGGSTTLTINTTIVPRLNAVNTFTQAQSITGVNANSGILTASNTSTNGGSGIFASTAASTGPNVAGVIGNSTATSGSGWGVLGQSFGSTGTGVEGVNQSATGTNFGVRGETQSTGVNSAGVYGAESAATGTTFGVYGQSISNAGIGVYGTEPSTTGTVYGVYGTTASTQGNGVFGQATASTGSATGGHFSTFSNAGNGVWGSSDNSAGIGIGVLGTASSATGVAGMFSNSGGGDLILGRTSAAVQFRVASTGNVTAAGTFTGGGADFAELVDVSDTVDAYEPGDVLVVDPTSNRRFALSREAYSPLVAGIYSTKPGMLGSRTSMDASQLAGEIPMAVVGIVPTKVSTENGTIHRGDLLVASSTPGYAMKGTDRDRMLGAVIGKALEPFVEGKGVIEVLVTVR
jgi:hypothetical protein